MFVLEIHARDNVMSSDLPVAHAVRAKVLWRPKSYEWGVELSVALVLESCHTPTVVCAVL